MRRLAPLLAACLVLGAARAQPVPEAAAAFDRRQDDLVSLSGHLGGLHRLRQLCEEDRPDLFRDRLLALVPLEAPPERTRLAMISAFNDGYREGSEAHVICGREARADYAARSEAALAVTERLYAPFRRQVRPQTPTQPPEESP